MDKKLALTIILLVTILVFGIWLRTFLLQYSPAMFQPDGYAYLSQIKQTIANHLKFTNKLDGIPALGPTEKPGLTYIVAIPAYLFNLNPLYVMYTATLIAGFMSILAVFFLAKQLSGNYKVALLAAFFIAAMPAAVHITSALEYRGETFVVPMLSWLLVILIDLFDNQKSTIMKQYAEMIGAILLTALIALMWSGSVYTFIILALFIIAIISFIALPNYSYRKTLGITFIVFIIAAIVAPYILPASFLNNIASQASINELKKPTAIFLFSTFGFALIFSAVGLIYLLTKKEPKYQFASIGMLSLFLVTVYLQATAVRWSVLLAPAIAVLGAYGLFKVYELFSKQQMMKMGSIAIMVLVIAITIYIGIKNAQAQMLANDQNPQLMQAMLWIRNNTAQNATFLTYWDDGSMIEAIANRSSFSDSVGAQSIDYYAFPRFLYAKAGNYTFLNQTKPDYLVVRKWWLNITYAIKLEGNLSQNTSMNGTNLQAFENKSISYPIVFNNSDTIIYKIAH